MSLSILIVDDDPEFRELLGGQLAAAGYEVRAVGSARDADRELEAQMPDLAIVDGFLADRDGEAWIVAQRRRGNTALPIVFVSAFASYARDHATGQRLAALGIVDVLSKPLDPSDLVTLVDKRLEQTRAERTADPATRRARMRRTYGAQLSHKLAVIATSVALAKLTHSLATLDDARRLANSLHGSAGSYGFHEVGEAAGTVSQLLDAASPSWDALDQSLAQLRAHVQTAQQQVATV